MSFMEGSEPSKKRFSRAFYYLPTLLPPIGFVLILVGFLLSLHLYPALPTQMVVHWGILGQPDESLERETAAFIIPLLMLLLFLLSLFLPKIDPLRKNIALFRPYFAAFILLLLVFLLSLHIFLLLWNLGVSIPLIPFICLWLSVLFFYVGVLCEHTEQNWFIGIRNPWTLSSKRIWRRVNTAGGRAFKLASLVFLLGILFPTHTIFIVLLPVITVALYTLILSYKEFKKEEARGHGLS